MMLVIIGICILVLIIIPRPKNKANHSVPIYFCDNGMDGHNERVADFYGYDSYKEMLKADGIDFDGIENKIIEERKISFEELVKYDKGDY